MRALLVDDRARIAERGVPGHVPDKGMPRVRAACVLDDLDLPDGGSRSTPTTRAACKLPCVPPSDELQLGLDPDAMGEELGRAISRCVRGRLRPCGHSSAGRVGRPVRCRRDALRRPTRCSWRTVSSDLAAIELESAAQIEKLKKSHAELRASLDVLTRTSSVPRSHTSVPVFDDATARPSSSDCTWLVRWSAARPGGPRRRCGAGSRH